MLADEGSQGVNITDCTFADTSGSAISIGNVTQAVLTPAAQDSDFTISNNLIRDTGAEYHGCAGIMAGYVVRASIEHNDIANSSNGAICLGWGWGAKNTMHSNKVNFNKIIRSNARLYDCGSIYTLSNQPNSEVAYNYIENQVLLYGSLYHDAQSGGFHTHHNVRARPCTGIMPSPPLFLPLSGLLPSPGYSRVFALLLSFAPIALTAPWMTR